MKIYGIKNCDTVKKALIFLEASSTEYTFIDLKKEVPSAELITKWVTVLGINVLINKKSATYRGLEEDLKNSLSIDTAHNIISMNTSIIKRPLIIHNNGDITVGFTNDIQEKING